MEFHGCKFGANLNIIRFEKITRVIAMASGKYAILCHYSMLSFDNTEAAFRHLSDSELRKAHFLFRIIGKNYFVKAGKLAVTIALKTGIPFEWALKKNIFSHFCGGETIEECAGSTEMLSRRKVGAILDFSVEGKEEESAFDSTAREIARTIDKATGNPDIPFCVFKMSGVSRTELLEKVNQKSDLSRAENEEWQRVQQRVNALCEHASHSGTPLFIDAEESWIQDAIDGLVEEMMERYNRDKSIVYTTLQMYRHDRLQYLERLFQRAESKGYYVGLKLVRGAYMEKERERALEKGYPSPIQPDKPATDRDFNMALEFCASHADRISVCAGTHNEESSLLLTRLMAQHGIAPNNERFWFAQLFGMSDHISFNLADSGYNVAKYLPYGPVREVIPYLIRRAEENTSVKGQSGRELRLIRSELKRRKVS